MIATKVKRAAASAVVVFLAAAVPVAAQTAFGEIEGRPAPVSRRQCVGGVNAGNLCSGNAGCPGSTCQTTNIFNVSVAVRFNATAAQLTTIRNSFMTASQILLDATDGQAQFGQITLLNNSTGTRGHFWVTQTGGCSTNTGSWGSVSAGNTGVSMTWLNGANGASCIAHEFVHQAFDARDEYETGCGAPAGGARCPDSTQGANSLAQAACLMECCGRVGNELCWGQAVADNLAGGNHDAPNITEQSRCRSNRSCWAQLGWSWPTTTTVPAGAPDAGTGGVAHAPNVFVEPASNARLVLVLDESGSMSAESPTRISRLRTAAQDVVDMAENGVELGLVSFSDSATDDVGLAALTGTRTAYTTAVTNLSPSGATNIGDGLQHARNMIAGAGGVTAATAVILMTDGRNNRPSGSAQTDLQQKIDLLLSQNIPVFVTCTGDDFGLDSQCAEIAAGTNGTYVDSADAAQLPERFVSFYEQILGRHPLVAHMTRVSQGKSEEQRMLVERGANVVTFAAHWRGASTRARLVVTDPTGRTFDDLPMALGRFVRVTNPQPGFWSIAVTDVNTPDTFALRAYIDNPRIAVPAYVRRKVIQPGETFHLCATPLQDTRVVGARIAGIGVTPSGREVPVELRDDGTPASGDEEASDGIYCALFNDTAERGGYTFTLRTEARGATQFRDRMRGASFVRLRLVDFERTSEVSGTVDDRQFEGNHYKLYRTKSEAPFEPRDLKLTDQFGRAGVVIRSSIALGNPVEKNGEDIPDRGAHLQCYAATDDTNPPDVEVSNQFGSQQRLSLGPAQAVCVPTAKNGERAKREMNDFKCYAAKGERFEREVTLADQFGKTRALVVEPSMMCNPAWEEEKPPQQTTEHLACYRIFDRPPDAFLGKTVETDNRFGKDRLTVTGSWLLCVPSTKEIVTKR